MTRLQDIVFLPTVQHTGTWFVIRFLQRFFKNFIEAYKILDGTNSIRDTDANTIILHTHFGITKQDREWQKKNSEMSTVHILAAIFKTVIPVRDPYRALLTRESRHPEKRHFYIVDGFLEMLNLLKNPNVFFFPIDLRSTEEEKLNLLKALLIHLRINPVEHIEYLVQIAEEWKPQNEGVSNRFKDLYENKQIEEIKILLGYKMAEIEYLKNNAAKLYPFLELLGYNIEEDIAIW